MRRTELPALLVLGGALASAVCTGGLGSWTAAPNSSAKSVEVGTDGSVYIDGDAFGLEIQKSMDHGTTWQRFFWQVPGASFYETRVLAVDPTGNLYAAFNTGGNANFNGSLYVSRDGGRTWTSPLQYVEEHFFDLEIDPLSATTLFLYGGLPLGSPSGVLNFGRLSRSTDGGSSWAEIDQTIIAGLGTQQTVTGFALDPRTRGRLFAAAAPDPFYSGSGRPPALWVSSDSGATWSAIATSLPAIFLTLSVDPFQPSRIYGGGPSGIYRSEDGGQTFVSTSAVAVRQILADPLHQNQLYAATTGSGVLASSDAGATWASLNSGLTDLSINALAMDSAGGYLYAATLSGLFAYQFPGAGTLVLNAAHPFSISLSATDQRTGRTGSGVAMPVNDLWGYFSLPAITGNPNNPEVFVKMLDGTALNGAYWFFYGGLTDLEYTLTVTETATGKQKTYSKPAGSECGGSDTAAFAP